MYLNVIIDKSNNTFYIQETNKKPKRLGSAASTLKKIDQILVQHIQYSGDHNDAYSHLSEKKLHRLLKDKAQEIKEGYWAKDSAAFISNAKKRKDINNLTTKIARHNEPASRPFSMLPDENFMHIASYLDVNSLAALEQANQMTQAFVTPLIVAEAKKYGYQGEDVHEAKLFIKQLTKEMKSLFNGKLLPKEYLAYSGKNIDIAKTLENLDKAESKDFLTLFSNPKYYFSRYRIVWIKSRESLFIKKRSYSILEPLLIKKADQCFKKDPLGNSINTQFKWNYKELTPLKLACMGERIDVVKLLLRQGVRVDGPYQPLRWAIGDINVDSTVESTAALMQVLIDAGANVNQGDRGWDILAFAVRMKNAPAVKFLIENGSQINHWVIAEAACSTLEIRLIVREALHQQQQGG